MNWLIKRSSDKNKVFKIAIPVPLIREKGWTNAQFVIINDKYPKEIRLRAIEKIEDITWPIGEIRTDD